MKNHFIVDISNEEKNLDVAIGNLKELLNSLGVNYKLLQYEFEAEE